MSLKERIDADLKSALLGGDKNKTNTLRGLKAVILDAEVSTGKRADGLGDSEIEVLIQKEISKRNESVTLYNSNSRPELADQEQSEIDIIQAYLPKQLTEDELKIVVDEILSSESDVSIKDMGRIIGVVKSKVGNSADGATIAKVIKSKLS